MTGVEDFADDQRGWGPGRVASLLHKEGTGTWGRCWVNSLPRHYWFLFLELWPGTNFEQCQFGYPLGCHWVWPWKRNPMPGKEGEKLSHLPQIPGWGGSREVERQRRRDADCLISHSRRKHKWFSFVTVKWVLQNKYPSLFSKGNIQQQMLQIQARGQAQKADHCCTD